jgi:Ca2+-binding EF-hand superfamily protein
MLSIETERRLAELLYTLAENERQVENSRRLLSENSEFDPYTCFNFLDRLRLGYLTASDFRDFFLKASIYCTDSEAIAIVKQYDSNEDGRLTLTDFYQITLPSTSPALREIALARPTRLGLSYDVEYQLTRLLEKELLLQRNLEINRQTLNARYDFNFVDAFRAIDPDALYADSYRLQGFMRRNGFNLLQEDIDALFRRLDDDNDARLNYREFVGGIRAADSSLRSTLSPSRSFYSEKRSQSPSRYTSPLRRSNGFRDAGSPSRSTGFKDFSSPLRSSKGFRETASPLRRSNGFRDVTSPVRSPARARLDRTFSPSRLTGSTSPSRLGRTSSPLRRSRMGSPGLSASNLSPSRFESPNKSTGFRSYRSSASRLASNLSEFDESELVRSFKQQIDLARELEAAKFALASRPDFNLVDGFRILDEHDKGYVSVLELEDVLRSLGIICIKDEPNLLVKHYSSQNDLRLRYYDFTTMFKPKDEEIARLLLNRTPYRGTLRDPFDIFTRETIDKFKTVVRLHIENESIAESIRQKLDRRPYFNLYEAFKAVDRDQNGFITLDEFSAILTSHGFFASSKDLQSLMERYDKDRDGRVSYSEFVSEVTPKSPRKY